MLTAGQSEIPSASPQNQIVSIQVLRGIAAVMVCLLHFTNGSPGYLPDGNLLKQIGTYGGYGVQIFFVVSGFILPYAMSKAGYTLADFGNFLVRRIARLDPPFLMSMILVVVLAYISTLSPLYRGKSFHFNWVDAALHLGYLNAFFGRPWLNPVYWTLAVEFQFYVFLGLLYPLFSKSGTIVRLILLGILLALGFWVTSNAFIFLHAPLFFMGIFSFLFYEKILKPYQFAISIFAFAVVGHFSSDDTAVAFGLLSVLAIFLLKTNNRILIFLGSISYSLYLVHQPVGSRIVNITEALTTNTGLRMMSSFLALLVSVGAAFIFYYFIELPSMQWSKRLAGKLKRQPALAFEASNNGRPGVLEEKQNHV